MKSVASLRAARKTPKSFGLSVRNLVVAAITLNDSPPVMRSVLVSSRWMFGLLSWRYWNGEEEKLATISLTPPSMAAVASGGAIDTGRGASALNLSGPSSSAAAIRRGAALHD